MSRLLLPAGAVCTMCGYIRVICSSTVLLHQLIPVQERTHHTYPSKKRGTPGLWTCGGGLIRSAEVLNNQGPEVVLRPHHLYVCDFSKRAEILKKIFRTFGAQSLLWRLSHSNPYYENRTSFSGMLGEGAPHASGMEPSEDSAARVPTSGPEVVYVCVYVYCFIFIIIFICVINCVLHFIHLII